MSETDSRAATVAEAVRTAAVRAHYEAGLAAHGDLGLSYEDFAASVWAHATRRVRREGGTPVPDSIREAIPRMAGADLFLATACDAYREPAWERFETEFVPRLAALARSRGCAADAARDAVDDLRQDLALPAPAGAARTLLGTFDGTGSLFAWLAAVLLRRLWKRAGKARTTVGGGAGFTSSAAERAEAAEPAAPPSGADPLLAVLDREQAVRFRAGFAAAWDRCTRNERMAILAAHRHGLLHREIANLLGVGRPRVTRLLASGIRRLREGVHESVGPDPAAGRRAWLALRDAIGEHLARMAPLEGVETPTDGQEHGRNDHSHD